MTIMEWFNSEPVRNFRNSILGSSKVSQCSRCYSEEDHGGNSRRFKSNQKSVIFTRTAFNDSFPQSPGYKHFSYSADHDGYSTRHPIDLHIDLGNFCNLACKMCGPEASSTIASQQVKWGIESSRSYLGTDWTKDQSVWNDFKQQLLEIPQLTNLHFMGGETLLTPRMEDLVDTMIEHEKFDLCFSFVSNGTVFKPDLLNKLKRFRRVGIEVSIETLDARNSYTRQGTDTAQVLENIQLYLDYCNNSSITLTLRPAISLLTIGSYVGLLQYALDRELIVKGLICQTPRFLSVEILPSEIKQLYRPQFETFLESIEDVEIGGDYNASDPHNYKKTIKEQAELCLNLLKTATPPDSDQQLELMTRHCERWDRVYGHDAMLLFPELQNILSQHTYDISS